MRSFNYAYDMAWCITNIAMEGAGMDGRATAYGYDMLDRLTDATTPGRTNTWSYDLADNRTNAVLNGTSTAYTLGIGDRLASTSAGATYLYSAAGCVTNISVPSVSSVVSLSWNSQYQLTAAYTNGALAESYQYDALGRRVATTSGGTTTYHVYDGGWQVLADLDADGQPLRFYTWGPGIDNLLAVTVYGEAAINTYYAITDHLGTVHALVDATGAIVESYEFDAWGNVTVYDDSRLPIPDSRLGNRYLFQGREYPFVTGLYHFRHRWYDPATGRWMSNDPIGVSGGMNQYAFCGNNPVNRRDPTGLCDGSLEDYPWGYEFPEPKMLDGWSDLLKEVFNEFLQDPLRDWALDNPLISVPLAIVGIEVYLNQTGGRQYPFELPDRMSRDPSVRIPGLGGWDISVNVGGNITAGGSLTETHISIDEYRIGIRYERSWQMDRKTALILGLVALNALTLVLSRPRVSVLNALRYRSAMRSIQRGHYDAAQSAFERIARTDPLDHRALRDLGQISHMKGDVVSATVYFAKASHLGDIKALDSLTGLHLQQTNYTEVAMILPILRQQARTNPRIAEKLVAFSVAMTNRVLWSEMKSGYSKGMYSADEFTSNLLETAEQFFSEKP